MSYHNQWMRYGGLFLFWSVWIAVIGTPFLRKSWQRKLYLAALLVVCGAGLVMMGQEGTAFNQQAPMHTISGTVGWTDYSPRGGSTRIGVKAVGGSLKNFTLRGVSEGRVVKDDRVLVRYQEESDAVRQLRVLSGAHPGFTEDGVDDTGWLRFMTGLGWAVIAAGVVFGVVSQVRTAGLPTK